MTASEGSPWFRRAGYVFAAYVALLAAIVAAAPSLPTSGAAAWPSLPGLAVLAVVAWLPFGPFFAACVFEDADWRRGRGRAVGDDWWLYLLSAVVQVAACWYLVRRATRGARDRDLGRPDAAGRE